MSVTRKTREEVYGVFRSSKEKTRYLNKKERVLKQLGYQLSVAHRLNIMSLATCNSEVSVDRYIRTNIILQEMQDVEVKING